MPPLPRRRAAAFFAQPARSAPLPQPSRS